LRLREIACAENDGRRQKPRPQKLAA